MEALAHGMLNISRTAPTDAAARYLQAAYLVRVPEALRHYVRKGWRDDFGSDGLH